MAIIDLNYYVGLFPSDDLAAADFALIEMDVERYLDVLTTTVDNVHKLTTYFPAEGSADEGYIKMAVARLVHLQHEIEQAAAAYALRVGADGQYSSGVVASRSSGSESVSYASGGAAGEIQQAAQSEEKRTALMLATAKRYLSGVCDSNGVYLLYGGVYPCIAIL